ncbi:MAG TPA: hypothetical protein VHC71_15940 [Hyphomicrobium sp.]|jgi:hypothetical protein|nr:hypothetical protein [Hyphomicrobium sp.]
MTEIKRVSTSARNAFRSTVDSYVPQVYATINSTLALEEALP